MKKLAAIIIALAIVACSALACFASEQVVPSVTAKDSPEFVEVSEGVFAEIIGASTGEQLKALTAEEILVTPYSEAVDEDSDIPEDVKANLVKAFEQIQGTDNLNTLNAGLDEAAKTLNPAFTAGNLVVVHLFDLSVPADSLELLNSNENCFLKVRLNLGLDEKTPTPIIMHLDDEEGWLIVDRDLVVNNGDGTVTVSFNSLCPIAVLTGVEKSGSENPGTSNIADSAMMTVVLCAIAFAAIGTAAYIRRRDAVESK